MNSLLEKISSYNIFNYLFPGVLFVLLLEAITPYSLIQKDLVVGVFLYYFVGMTISRLGSLVIEPILRKTSFLNFAKYEDYVQACIRDVKLETLSEVNNTYRTLCALFVTLGAIKVYERFIQKCPFIEENGGYILIISLLLLFLLSYRKQTAYITNRSLANFK